MNGRILDLKRPARPLTEGFDGRVLRAHGGGGSATRDLLEAIVFPRLSNLRLDERGDSAVWSPELKPGERLAFTTDAFVVTPLEFPGGDLGRLAVCGTVNDLAVSGARPQAISLALILEEGLPFDTLRRLVDSARSAAEEAGVEIVTGDTKVIESRGDAGCFAVTSGIGVIPSGRNLSLRKIRPGDAIIVTASIANHGTAIMAARDGIGFSGDISSDAMPLNGLVEGFLRAVPDTRFLRDATRGGVSGVVCEVAESTEHNVRLRESALPIRPGTRAALELLWLDPLDVANEGVLIAIVPGTAANFALEALRSDPAGREAAIIGSILDGSNHGDLSRNDMSRGHAELETSTGGRRILVPPYGDKLPRIC